MSDSPKLDADLQPSTSAEGELTAGRSPTPDSPTTAVLGSQDWSEELPPELADVKVVALDLTTQPPITNHLARTRDGRFFHIWWDTAKRRSRWSQVSEDYAREEAEQVRKYRGKTNWLDVFSDSPEDGTVGGGVARSLDGTAAMPKRTKKSHGKGGARAKIHAGFLNHHRYSNGRCEYFEPVKVNEFADAIQVSPGSVSGFLKRAFGDYDAYAGACRQRSTLEIKLTAMSGDFTTIKTAGRNPLAAQEGDRDEDDD